jgi:hypothetical protein
MVHQRLTMLFNAPHTAEARDTGDEFWDRAVFDQRIETLGEGRTHKTCNATGHLAPRMSPGRFLLPARQARAIEETS